MIDFALSTVLNKYADNNKLLPNDDLSTSDSAERRDQLNELIETLSAEPDEILQEATYDSMENFVACVPSLSASEIHKLADLISSAILAKAQSLAGESPADFDSQSPARTTLEALCFMNMVFINTLQTDSALLANGEAAVSVRGKAKSKKQKETAAATVDIMGILVPAFDAMSKVLSLRAAKMWPTTSERDAFVSLMTKPAYLVAESETLMKKVEIRMRFYKIVCVAVKHHGHAFGAQTTIVQDLQYFEHLSDPLAELLHILNDQYDFPQLTDEVLRELSNKDFNANDNKGPKFVSVFLVKLSELMPGAVLKQVGLLAKFLDCESYNLRSAIIELCGNLIANLSKEEAEEGAESSHKAQISGFFDLLEERFLDSNPYCRSKVLQTYVKLCDLQNKFPKRRQKVSDLATQALDDKSSNVRRNAIKLLARLVQTHPFDMLHGPQLSLVQWRERVVNAQAELDILQPEPELVAEPDEELIEAPESPQKAAPKDTEAAQAKAAEAQIRQENIMKLQMTKRYYTEATRFVETLTLASQSIVQLLASKTKTEVMEAMDFFVVADAYKLEPAKEGIRRMLHLIWTKATSDEGKGVTLHLLDCYRGLFFEAPDQLSANDQANFVAKNMISLTYGATLAELTSLEQLLKVMMKDGQVNDEVIAKLWQVYGVQRREISKNQRRGAIIILGMLALANRDIIVNGLDVLLQVAFGSIGKRDLALMRYSCIALQRLGTGEKAQKGELRNQTTKLPDSHGVFSKLVEVITKPAPSKEWFGVAEQAIDAIYALAEHPDEVCSDIIKHLTQQVFAPKQQPPTPPRSRSVSPVEEHDEAAVDAPEAEESSSKSVGTSRHLADLLFVVGHVSIKQIVYIEECEGDFKRRKAEADKAKHTQAIEAPADGAKDDLDLVNGTTEDEFADAMTHIRERELLFGDKSILARFGPLVTEVCRNNKAYPCPILQTAATMTLAKFMCVSGAYCEANLELLLLILEKSTSAATRSNLVIAMGDMTVCFNHILDNCSDHLYRRLRDEDPTVKKTCLMTLTFLVLAGQVKVKGQLGEMAKCLEDDDKRITDLARMFFTELATKDNAIYNGFTDIFSLLSSSADPMDEDVFRRIIRFLMTFIEKDKYAKQLADKLASRLVHCVNQRQFDDVVFALGCLPPQAKSETVLKLVSDGYAFAVAAQ
ncbi:armadillo-type protein [Protomyces lactucae-debilis]|uniref:Condensin complex subunit 1 n=1 Tax=Protomyces lactucae-debilis TaxID=2754530 RepID=A0A1Y2F696_PROLT|nr:armadillo-type protein [Protomyces lactucae-debilis]ORY79393.1 armadillo-type protein [Protomyces lactucae-debilis]